MFQAIKRKGFRSRKGVQDLLASEKLKKQVIASFDGKHDCSIRSLLLVMPELNGQEVKNAFVHCSQWYPYGAVTNKEFNMALRFLGIFDKFEYDEPQDKDVRDFIEGRESTHIILVYGHYTVASGGRIVDFFPILNDRKVYCSWSLKEGRK